jgi:hypothetical protein
MSPPIRKRLKYQSEQERIEAERARKRKYWHSKKCVCSIQPVNLPTTFRSSRSLLPVKPKMKMSEEERKKAKRIADKKYRDKLKYVMLPF